MFAMSFERFLFDHSVKLIDLKQFIKYKLSAILKRNRNIEPMKMKQSRRFDTKNYFVHLSR
jgi:hypothetical protein